MKPTLSLIISLFWAITTAAPLSPTAKGTRPPLPRLVLYYQTTHDPLGRPISLLPLIHTQHIALTHLIVGAIHLHANHTLHLNDHAPHHPLFHTLWTETRILQSAGVKVLAMVGGAAQGSFARSTLDARDPHTFERSYALLRDIVKTYGLDGVDLDVEERMTLRGVVRLVRRLRADFGGGFVITLAPVATALVGRGNLSGFSYKGLEREVGREVAFYNAQFYNGFGWMGSGKLFDLVVAAGWDPRRVVVGQLTSPENGGGFVRHEVLGETVGALRRRYGEIGGVAGWEYFNAVPGGDRQPWRWAEAMTAILRPGREPVLRINAEMAERLNEAWIESAAAARGGDCGKGGGLETVERWGLVPNVDYLGMVNEK